MDTEIEIRPKYNNRLFLKTYTRFALVITVFAVILGMLYMRMYERAAVTNYENQQTRKAESIAKQCSQYFVNEAPNAWTDYLIQISELDETEVWTVYNSKASKPLGLDMMAVGPDALEQYAGIVEKAFAEGIVVQTEFSSYHQCDVVTVAVPVQGINGEVAGAIILTSPVATQKKLVDNSWNMILYSGMVALVIAFVVATPFAREMSKPIAQMRSTALQLAAGDYKAKTGIVQYDEIGELATTIDFLADKLAENEIERQNIEQMRNDFFANVSHELRTPVTVVRAYTEALVDGMVPDEEKKKQQYARMLSECQNMERLVGDLLLLSKMRNPDFKVEKEPVTLQQIFMDMNRAAKTIAEAKHIEIVMDEPEEPCFMMGDYIRLRQMFMVIVDNAIKFSKKNSSIYITVECDKFITVSIRDEGVGISEEELPNIFEKFYKSKLRQNAKGSGLGLAIAREICLKHNGTVMVESELGKGTTFIFTFPKMEELKA